MGPHTSTSRLPGVLGEKPLQALKFLGILLILVFGVAGFFRLLDASVLVGDPRLADGQFLTLLLIPLLSLLLVVLVFLETLVTVARIVRADSSWREHLPGGIGYLLLRGVEAAIAVVGVLVMVTAVPTLFAESTPAPAGVGIMLLLLVVGLAILVTSFVRAGAELFVYRGSTG